ncbi:MULTISPECIES: hypothetical protein [Calditerrivibrio]|jgi:hypothetical protein|uniref:TonB C-terminal domain-containing protein n=1 Tax=Calditerrivibrio nitroreducens TaxID=477976 RepID=A0A2J6WH75_9BACT|nr:MAG: hypothetical protein C0187_06460 [Calditerrivibrio nitroreducens]
MNKSAILISLLLSILIHLAIFMIPIKNDDKREKLIVPKIFIVDFQSKSVSNDFSELKSIEEKDLLEKINEYLKNINATLNPIRDIPRINNSFDEEEYHTEFLKILNREMDIRDYLEEKGLKGEYLFKIDIEGSGRVRTVETIRREGSQELEEYVIKRLKSITFPPHGELILTIKVNMRFELD